MNATPDRRRSDVRRLLCLTTGSAAIGAFLLASGSGELAAPPLSPDRWSAWLHDRSPVAASLAVVRIGAICCALYLCAVLLLGVFARVSRRHDLRAFSDRCTVRPLRELLDRVFAGTAMAALSIMPLQPGAPAGGPGEQAAPRTRAPAAAVVAYEGDTANGQRWPVIARRTRPENPQPPPVLVRLPDAPIATTTTKTTTTITHPSATVPVTTASPGNVPTSAAAITASTVTQPTSTPPGSAAPLTSAAPAVVAPPAIAVPSSAVVPANSAAEGVPRERTWRVRRGEHFWVIAQHVTTERNAGRPVSRRELVTYWHLLIEANRANLPDPANPDLLYPGTELTLPK